MNEQKQWGLLAISEALNGIELPIVDGLTIGRASDNHLVLSSKRVSRYHANLTIINSFLYVKDLGSSNGTFLNGEQLIVDKSRHLKADDIISFAGFEFMIQEDAIAEQQAVDTPVIADTKQPIDTTPSNNKDNQVAEKLENTEESMSPKNQATEQEIKPKASTETNQPGNESGNESGDVSNTKAIKAEIDSETKVQTDASPTVFDTDAVKIPSKSTETVSDSDSVPVTQEGTSKNAATSAIESNDAEPDSVDNSASEASSNQTLNEQDKKNSAPTSEADASSTASAVQTSDANSQSDTGMPSYLWVIPAIIVLIVILILM